MAEQERRQGLSRANKGALAVLFTIGNGGLSLVWLWSVLVILGQLSLRPTHASAAAFVRAYVGGPTMLFLAAAWIGFVVWVSESYLQTKGISALLRRFLRVTAWELLLFPLFHLGMILLTRQVLSTDWIIGGGATALAWLLWRLSARMGTGEN